MYSRLLAYSFPAINQTRLPSLFVMRFAFFGKNLLLIGLFCFAMRFSYFLRVAPVDFISTAPACLQINYAGRNPSTGQRGGYSAQGVAFVISVQYAWFTNLHGLVCCGKRGRSVFYQLMGLRRYRPSSRSFLLALSLACFCACDFLQTSHLHPLRYIVEPCSLVLFISLWWSVWHFLHKTIHFSISCFLRDSDHDQIA